MKKFSRIALVMLLACLACLSFAGAAQAEVTGVKVSVEVQGESSTLLPAKKVETTTEHVVNDGNPEHFCLGTSALGALQVATKGEWSGTWSSSFHQYTIETILGESHPFSSTTFWAFWLNGKLSNLGACAVKELKTGAKLLFKAECQSKCETPSAPGGEKSGATNGQDGAGQTKTNTNTGGGTGQAGAGVLTIDVTSLHKGHRYRHGHAPRLLAGRVLGGEDVSSVSLSLRRIQSGHCHAYDASHKRFSSARCGKHALFKVSSTDSFSYLLPAQLAKGRYVLDVQASGLLADRIGHWTGSSEVAFDVG
jgi:hypothetical protein